VVRLNTEQVQGQADFAMFDEWFADDFVDHTPSPALRPTRPAFASSTTGCDKRFPIFDPRSVGKRSTPTSSPRSRPTTVPTSAASWHRSHRQRRSISRRSTPCGFAVERSPTTGAWQNMYSVLQQLGQLPPT
jgi:hypothetical protein